MSWEIFDHDTFYLLIRPIILNDHRLWNSVAEFESEESIDLWNNLPPAIRTDLFGDVRFSCVIVPSEIER